MKILCIKIKSIIRFSSMRTIRGLLIFLLLTVVRCQDDLCSCSCCIGQSCTPTLFPSVSLTSCTLERCLSECRRTYQQCQTSYPQGVLIPQCESNSKPQFDCTCACCIGSSSCSLTTVGNAMSYVCQSGACSIACADKYPNRCISNQYGRTEGTCIGRLSTTSTTSTTTSRSPALINDCSCYCCQNGPNCIVTNVGVTSASQCSSNACTQSCQQTFPAQCPISGGRTEGACTVGTNRNIQCKCQCCFTNGCRVFLLLVNGYCQSCQSACAQDGQCRDAYSVTYTCRGTHLSMSKFSAFILLGLSILFCSILA